MRLNTILSTCLFLVLPFYLDAQSMSCGMDVLWAKRLEADPALRQRHEAFEQQRYEQLTIGKIPASAAKGQAMYTLPVVVHIIHQNGAENISDAQVIQGIQQLNDAFANSGYYDNGDGVTTPFQFCLARRLPNGAPISGIYRVVSPLTNVTMETEDQALKALSILDPAQYINIWVVAEITSQSSGNGVAGYAYLPSAHGQPFDGIVMEARWLGTSPGKTGVLIHEMGHYLGLYHTFEGGCTNDDCAKDGDKVCDTPPDQSTSWTPCGTLQNSCTTDANSGFATDQNDMTINYMDYATLDCYNAFTAGQSNRMEFYLLNVRESLLGSKACLDPCLGPVTASFTSSAGPTVPAGASVNFTNTSVNGIQYEWLLNGVPFASTADASYLFAQSGVFVVELHAIGSPDDCDDRASYTLQVICQASSSFEASSWQPELGETVNFVSTSQNATQLEWMVNGVPQATTPTWSVVFPGPGAYNVCLTAYNGGCQDVSCRFMEVRDTQGCFSVFAKRIMSKSFGTFRFWDMAGLPGGGLISAGDVGDAALLRFSAGGDLAQSWRLNNQTVNESLAHVFYSSDETIMCSGNAGMPNGPTNFVAKFDYNLGQPVWYKHLTFPDINVYSKSVLEHPVTGNYWCWNISDQTFSVADKIFVTELDRLTGNILTRREYSGANVPIAYCTTPGFDKFYSCGGIHAGPGLQYMGLARYDNTGNVEWSKSYRVNTSPYNTFSEIIQDGASLVAVTTTLLILKTDLDGNVIWRRLYTPTTNYSSSTHTEPMNLVLLDDGYLICGANKKTFETNKIYLVKINKNGDLVWARIIDAQEPIIEAEYVVQNNILWITVFNQSQSSTQLLKVDISGDEPVTCYPVTDMQLTEETNFTLQVVDHVVLPMPTPNTTATNQTYVITPDIAWEVIRCSEESCGEICDNGRDDDDDGYVDCYDVADCPCQNDPPPCSTADTLGTGFTGRMAWKSDPLAVNSISTPIVANLNPGVDSIPEIIVLEGDPGSNNDQSNNFLIFRGDGVNAAAPDVLAVPGKVLNRPANFPTTGDVDGDGNPELVVVCADRFIRVFSNYQAGGAPPMQLWMTSTDPVSDLAQRPFLADFNRDGVPEVFAGTEIFQFDLSNPALPTLKRVSGPNQLPYGRLNTTVTNQFSCSPVAADLLRPADCNGDPDCDGLEIAAGNAIYSVDLNTLDGDPVQVKKQKDLNTLSPGQAFSDGYTSVADIDLDGILDILVAGRRGNQNGVYAWNKTGLLKFFPYPLGASRGGGIVAVANVYNDKTSGAAQDFPELLASCENQLVCYNLNRANQTPAAPWWWSEPTDDLSGSLGVSTFDFNNDSWPEILLRDQNGLRVMYGGSAPYPAGVNAQRNWMVFSMGTGTIDEYPVVADLDADGQAEITMTGHETPGVPPPSAASGRLWVFEADPETGRPWLSARPFWNQFSYFIVNANDDLRIPKEQQATHLELPGLGSGQRPLNRFLGQLPLHDSNFNPYLPLPDATVSAGDLRCDGDSLRIRLEVCNSGSAALPAGMPLRLYAGDPTVSAAAVLPGDWRLPAGIPAGSCLSMEVAFPVDWDKTIYVVVNDNGNTPPPFSLTANFPVTGIVECDYSNNLSSFPLPPALPPIDLGPDINVCQNGVWTFNAGAGFASYKWSTLSTDSLITVFTPGTYWVEARDQCGLVYTDTVVVGVRPETVIDLGPDTLLCGSQSLQFDVPGFAEYEWLPGADLTCTDCPNPTATPATDMTFIVLAKTADGCYSADSIRVTLRPAPAAQLDTAICQNTSLWWSGVEIPAGTSKVFSFTLAQGCDSTFTVQVAALPLAQTQESRTICAGDSVLVFGQWQTQAGTYQQKFATVNGCDSTHTVVLAVLPTLQTQENFSICSGDSILVFGQWQMQAGNYQQIFTAQSGCDSMHVVSLAVLPALQTQESQAICVGDSVQIFGQWQTLAGVYQQTFAAQSGCDSTHTVTLEVLPVLQTQESRTFCAGDSVQIFGQWQTQAGVYQQTFTAQGGCDSTHTVTLGVLPVVQTQESQTLCAGDSVQIFGQWQMQAGVYQQTFTAQNGCDSTHTVTLGVLPVVQTQESRTLCVGDSVQIFGQWQTQAGVYQQTFAAQNGCDSTHTVLLNLLPALQTQESQSICAGDSVLIFGQWQMQPGLYQKTLNSQSGCDSIHTVNLIILPPPELVPEWADPTCFGLSDGYISAPVATPGMMYSLDGVHFQANAGFQGLNAGTYTLTARDPAGCTTTTTLELLAPAPLLLELPGDTTIFPGQSVQLTATTNGSALNYAWSPPEYLDCPDCPAPLATPLITTEYTLVAQDVKGCTATDRTTIRVTGPAVYVPNVFAPTQSGLNEIFGVYASAGVRQVVFMEIFDRWGGLVYRREGFAADGLTGWDGRWRGQDCAPGVYVYSLELELEDGSRWKKTGDVTLLR